MPQGTVKCVQRERSTDLGGYVCELPFQVGKLLLDLRPFLPELEELLLLVPLPVRSASLILSLFNRFVDRICFVVVLVKAASWNAKQDALHSHQEHERAAAKECTRPRESEQSANRHHQSLL